jgi:hypothetical protein
VSAPNAAALHRKEVEMSVPDEAPELVMPSSDGGEWPTTSPDDVPTPPGRTVVVDEEVLAPAEADTTPQVEMCCDGSGRTAEEHRAESADHKCCVDH